MQGLKKGAADFITKPWDNLSLLKTIETTLNLSGNQQNHLNSREELDPGFNFSNIIGNDPKLIAVLETISRVAKTNASILILGESGTGKELIADAVHHSSLRCEESFVKVNLGGMNSALFESEMFGHVKGAFTDAIKDRKGRFEVADKGTIFLDEIGDLDPASQVKLLRVLQDQTFQPVGSSQTIRSDVRVVSATNRNLSEMVDKNEFREDLLYRLNLITIELPPLRERRGDIEAIATNHLERVEKLYGLQQLVLTEDAVNWLRYQPWPGNIRQLNQTIERVALMSGKNHLTANDFERHINQQTKSSNSSSGLPTAELTLDEMEKLMIEKSLTAYQGNLTKVADALGISRAALYRRLEKYGLKE